jgi:hypothetical protein
MGFISDYVFGIPKAAASSVKEWVIDPLTGKPIGARAKAPAKCPQGYVLDPLTGVELCIGDLVLDPETGDLITPAEAQRRQREGLVWDETGEEWITPAELRSRERRRAQQAEFQRQREEGELVRDRVTNEWVSPEELSRRRRTRNALRIFMGSQSRQLLDPEAVAGPRLSLPAASMIRIGTDGVARIGGERVTADTLEDSSVGTRDVLDLMPGPERREAEEQQRGRMIKYAILAALVGALAYGAGRAS